MKKAPLILCLTCLITPGLAWSVFGADMKAYQMREDYGTELLSDCTLQYYYYVPCPTYGWFWAFSGGVTGDKWGTFFEIGDLSLETGTACNPDDCHSLDRFRILDFAGYGTIYPGIFTIQFDIYCSDAEGCPISPSLWTSGPYETAYGWNYVTVDQPLCLTQCCAQAGPPPSRPRILIVSTYVGYMSIAWGMDNISTPLEQGCEMHDLSSLPALYPRPYNSHYPRVHSGYYGEGFRYCPPWPVTDGRDTTDDYSQFGAIELAWRIYLSCTGPTSSLPATWSTIKSLYR